MNDIFLIAGIEFRKFSRRKKVIVFILGFMLFALGVGWLRYQSSSIDSVGTLSGFQLAAFIASTSSPLLTLLVILLASSSLSSEMIQGTLKLVLTRPVRRSDLILGKLLTIYFIALGLVVILWVLGLGTGSFFSGLTSLTEKEYIIYSRAQLLGHFTLGFLTALLPLFAWGSVAFLFSSVIPNPTGSLAASLVLYFIFLLLLPFDEIPPFSPNQFINFSFEMAGKVMRGLPAEWSPAVYTNSAFSLLYIFLTGFLTLHLFQRKDILS